LRPASVGVAAAFTFPLVRTDPVELKSWFFYSAPKGVKLAEMRNGHLRDAIERRKPDLVAFDPFIRLHALEENDSGAMDFVCDLLTKLSIEYDIAIDAPHHTRKGQLAAGDADNGRGASSMRDAMRLVSTLTTMSEDEAKMFDISEIDRHDYVRLDPPR
jgi:RecA-family ATPase